MRIWLVLTGAAVLSACATGRDNAQSPVELPAASVQALRETDPVGTARADAADDPAIWRNSADPQRSIVLGTDKKAGLYSYGMDGKVRDFVPAGALNNVDLREVEVAKGNIVILVAASDRTDLIRPKIALFALDGSTGKLTGLGTRPVYPETRTSPAEAYGFCMGGGLAEGELARTYVVMKDGEVAETRLRQTSVGIV